MCLQGIVISVAYGKTFVVPYLPSGFIQRLYDRKYPVPVLMRVADEYVGSLLVREKRRRDPLYTGRDHPVEGLVLVVEDVRYTVLFAVPVRV